MLFAGIADTIFNVLFKVILGLINIVLFPLNNLIASQLEGVNTALIYLSNYFNVLGDYVSFGLSYLGFYPELISSVCLIVTAIVMIPFVAHSIKLIVKWYNALKP